jgi:hypothetical protein
LEKTGLLLLSVFLASCASPPPPERPLACSLAPHGVAIVVHGAYPDGDWSSWDQDEVALLEEEGFLAASLDYRCHGLEHLLTDEAKRQGARIASALADLEAAHERTSCKVPLRVLGVGYSMGTTVLVEAALAGSRFHEVTFGGSPIFFKSGDLGQALTGKQIEHLVNYHSLIDGLVWPMIPCGIWGYAGAGGGHVENRLDWQVHVIVPFAFHREEIAREAVRSFGQDAHRECMEDPVFRLAWKRARRLLEDRSAADHPGGL